MNEVISYLNQKLKKGDTIILGLSGGPDSMCLFSLLLQIKEKLNLNIICAHVNHNLRKESEEEQTFVEKIVKENKSIFEYLRIKEYKKENIEQFARKKRYLFFEELRNKYKANYIMTAHHGDDLIETILMRLVRGSSFKGYAGFNKETDFNSYQLLRPLIYTTKDEIEKYNKINHINYCIDQSNFDTNYTRNRYRHKILPILKEENKTVNKKFLKFNEMIFEIEEFLKKETENALTKVLEFDKVNLHEFNNLDLVLQKRVLKYIIKNEYQENIPSINEKHLQQIMNICKSNKANLTLNLPMKKTIIKSYNQLYFKKSMDHEKNRILLNDYCKINSFSIIKKVESCETIKSNYVLRLNSKDVKLPLYVRYRNPGDFIEIKNLKGRKKVKNIFIDEKIPIDKRDHWPIIVDSNDIILWIPGIKKSKFDRNIDEFYDIIYKYVMSEEC